MSSQGSVPGERRKQIGKEDADRARRKRPAALRLEAMTADELAVLLADVSAELAERGGSDVIPRGLMHRMRRTIEQ